MVTHDHCQCDYCSGEDCEPFKEFEREREIVLKELVRDGITEDAAHHKQWYLEQIAKNLGIDISDLEYERGIPP
jgi:hypothetical protein